MIAPGGPSAIYGFLFQVLRTAEWALRIDLSAPRRDASNVMIIAEPRGGDIQIRLPHRVLVQQFKTRDGRAWNFADIVDEVLTDLYRGVTDEGRSARYELATNGAMGDWAAALEFFRSLAQRADADIDSLDQSLEKFPLRRKRHTERSLFEEIVRVLRKRKPARDEPEEVTRRKLWHLLGRFDFVPTGNSAEAETAVRRLLSSYVVDDDRLDDKLARLVKTVLGYSTEGERSFTPEELLSDSEIEGVSFTKLPLVREALRQLTLSDMRRLARFEPSLSVRPPIAWPEGERILVLSGESGQGKSWVLAELAHDLLANDHRAFVVFARATGDLEKDLTRAAQRIVRDALGHNTSAPFEQLVTKIRKETPELANPWLTVCLDDVRVSSEVIALCDAPLEDWGIRVALTTLPRQAAHASLARREARVEAVRDFSDVELRTFLDRHGREWVTIPPDVRKTMRRPLLADIFVRLAKEWRPRNEYELYNAVWQRLISDGEQTEHPADMGAMLALAADFRDGGVYPWSPSALRRIGITDEEQSRLEAIGWFTREPNGAVRIWHDRLLNWAVGEKIAEEVPELRRTGSSLAAVLSPYFADDPADPERPRLSYVPMDFLWMVANRRLLPAAELAQVIEELESNSYNETATLYRLLGSIGPHIVPSLAERVHHAETRDDQHGNEMLVRDTVRRALRNAGDEAEPHVRLLLNDASETLRNIGVIVAGEHPSAAHVPRLWEMLLEHDRQVATGTAVAQYGAAEFHWRRERLTAALAASVDFAPQWLETQIAAIAPNDPHVATLAWLLASLKGPEGRRLWLNVKETLFDKTPRDKPGGLIACIRNFRDESELPRLEEWLTSEHDFAAPSALGAVAIVAPERAIAFVRSGPYTRRSGFSSWWFPWLMLVRKVEALALARERLDEDDTVPECFDGSEEHLDAATAHALVARLSKQLGEFLAGPPPERRVGFARSARVLAAAAHLEILDVLASYRGTEFEERLVAAAERLPHSDHEGLSEEGADIRTILRRVSDAGSVRVIVSAIGREGRAPIAAIDWAIAYPIDEIRDALRAFVKRCAEGWDGKFIPHRVTRAVRSLALIGDDEGVIEAISNFGANGAADDLPWLLGDHAPMDSALVEKLIAGLASSSIDEQCRALGALRLSRRRDLVPMLLERAHSCDDAVRWHALKAARDLTERGTEIAPLVRDLVEGEAGEDRHIVASLLYRSGTTASLDLLAQFARKLPFNHVNDHTVVEWLIDRSPRGKAMAELLEKHLLPFPHAGLYDQEAFIWVRLLPALDREDLRQKALEVAGTPIPMVNPLSVIECVATFDPVAAFEFTVAALRSDVKGREVLPPFLLKYDAVRAADTLLRLLPEERSGPVRWSIARTLRWSGDDSLSERLDELWASPSADVRAAACDLAGWIPTLVDEERLRAAALSDEDQHVRMAARDALDRRLRLRQASALRDRVMASSGTAAWVIAEAFANYADPFLLGRRSDPLSIYAALETRPRALADMVDAWLDERRKRVVRDAESEDLVRGRRPI